MSSLFIFLNAKTNAVTNLNPFNSVNKSISLLLIAYSVSLISSSGLKELKISTLEELEKPLKACSRFVFFYIFSFKKIFTFSYEYVKNYYNLLYQPVVQSWITYEKFLDVF